jgi:hypothetical protein
MRATRCVSIGDGIASSRVLTRIDIDTLPPGSFDAAHAAWTLPDAQPFD